MWTLPRNTCRATVPPMIAAAMLSRKARQHEHDHEQRTPPVQLSGSSAGISSGTALSSK